MQFELFFKIKIVLLRIKYAMGLVVAACSIVNIIFVFNYVHK